jgi:hypothetical protein
MEPDYSLLRQALQQLHIAEHELNRPDEDAVTLCACNSTRNALNGFLRTFLLKHSESVHADLKPDEMLSMCMHIDPKFGTISLSGFTCNHLNDEANCDMYCLSVEKVNECFKAAKAVKDLVLTKLQLSEKDFA